MRRTIVAAATVLAVGAVLASGQATAGTVGDRDGSDPLAWFHHQKIAWHACTTGPGDDLGAQLDAAGVRCGEVIVPLDYARPRGRTITLAMARTTATDPARRRGTLMLNPGGPGEPAMGLAAAFSRSAPDLAARFDMIGMDPRFVGRSTPVTCAWTTDIALRSAGPNRATFDESVAFARDLAAGCVRGNGDVLPYASTRNTARDMDVVRAALGEPKLSYVGWSYGSYLGAVYMQMFTGRVDRFVLDSAVDPAAYGPEVSRPMGGPTQAALSNWAGWAAARDGIYRLGATRAAVLATVDRVNRAAADRPLRVGGFKVDSHVLPLLLFIPIRSDTDESYASIAADVRVLADAAGGAPVTPTPTLTQNLMSVFAAPSATAGRDGTFILCADRATSHDPQTYRRDIEAHRASEPLFGPLTRNVNPCAFWPTGPVEPPIRIGSDVPALMVGASNDPRTPYAGQQAMHRALTGSRMITLDGAFRHIVYGAEDVPCVTDTVGGYLLDGRLPAADVTCVRPAGR